MATEPTPDFSAMSLLRLAGRLGVENEYLETVGAVGSELERFTTKAAQGKASQADYEEIFQSVNYRVDDFVDRSIPKTYPNRDAIGTQIKTELWKIAVNDVPKPLRTEFDEKVTALIDRGALHQENAKAIFTEFFSGGRSK